jgi:hypothetical protein
VQGQQAKQKDISSPHIRSLSFLGLQFVNYGVGIHRKDAFAQIWSDSSRENIERGLRYNAKNALSNGQKILGYRTAADKRYELSLFLTLTSFV